MLNNIAAYKYETPYRGPFVIPWFFTNGTVNLQQGATKFRYNIRRIKPYKSNTNVEDIKPENTDEDVNVLSPVIYFYVILNIGHKIYNWICMRALRVDSNLSY